MTACDRCAKCLYPLIFNYYGRCNNCLIIIDKKMWQKHLTTLCRKAIDSIFNKKYGVEE